jgi:hypothetical protein
MDTMNLKELSLAARYYAFIKSTKGKSTVNIILGILGIVLGLFYAMVMNPINLILVLIGAFLLSVGIWAKAKPTLNSLLFSGIALMVIGGWNFVVFILNFIDVIASFPDVTGFGVGWVFGAFWGGLQITWGNDALQKYRRYSLNPAIRPSPELLKQVEETIKPVLSANLANEEIIQFTTQGGYNGCVWRGKLDKPVAILSSKAGDDIHFVSPQELQITQTGKFRKLLKVSFRINGQTYKGTITPISFERYENWKKTFSTTPS